MSAMWLLLQRMRVTRPAAGLAPISWGGTTLEERFAMPGPTAGARRTGWRPRLGAHLS